MNFRRLWSWLFAAFLATAVWAAPAQGRADAGESEFGMGAMGLFPGVDAGLFSVMWQLGFNDYLAMRLQGGMGVDGSGSAAGLGGAALVAQWDVLEWVPLVAVGGGAAGDGNGMFGYVEALTGIRHYWTINTGIEVLGGGQWSPRGFGAAARVWFIWQWAELD